MIKTQSHKSNLILKSVNYPVVLIFWGAVLQIGTLVYFRGPKIYFAKFWELFKKTSGIKCKKCRSLCSKGLGMVALGRVRVGDTKTNKVS
jgi:hypothetical protein